MPYFINTVDFRVYVTPPGRDAPMDCRVIDGETAAACEGALTHGMQLTPSQAAALLDGDLEPFLAGSVFELPLDDPALDLHLRPLPALGLWEYKVIPLTEMLGIATAKGTAGRMESELNRLSQQGWELATTSERDSRWIGGETVILTLRRWVVTEKSFAARYRAEEAIRRRVCAELDEAEMQS